MSRELEVVVTSAAKIFYRKDLICCADPCDHLTMRNSTGVCSRKKSDVLVRQASIRGRYWLVCGSCRAGQTDNVTSCDGRGWWASLHSLALARTWNRESTCRSTATGVAQRSTLSPLSTDPVEASSHVRYSQPPLTWPKGHQFNATISACISNILVLPI